MSRSLRPRTKKQNYAVAFDLDSDEEGQPKAGPSKKRVAVEEDNDDDESGSDFAPEQEAAANGANDEDEDEDEEDVEMGGGESLEDLLDDEAAVITPATVSKKGKGKKRGPSKAFGKLVSMPAMGGAAGIARTSKRQVSILPTPSVHHRHRAVPLFPHTGRVERPHKGTRAITNRGSRAWGFNVGAGGLWDMVEDRGWYKEALPCEGDYATEATRRPVVYPELKVQDGWKVLGQQEATQYLPTDSTTTEEGNFNPPPPVPCLFGPFGNQQPLNVAMFQTVKNSQFFPKSKAHTFNPGAPAWGIDWCPIHPDDRAGRSYTQYLAVGPLTSASHSPDIGVKAARPFPACIQIWTLSPTNPAALDPEDAGVMNGALYRPMTRSTTSKGRGRENSVCLLEPSRMAPFACLLSRSRWMWFPLATTRLFLFTSNLSLSFVSSLKKLLVFHSIGETAKSSRLEPLTARTIAVFDLGPYLKTVQQPSEGPRPELLPSHYITVHQSAIRAICWARSPPSWPSGEPRVDVDPTVICSGGYDGLECITDIRDGHGSIMNRTRDVVNSMTFSSYGGGPITIDHENIVKVFSLSPSMLGRGHILMEPEGPIWSLNASELHPSIAVGSADGVCSTTNSLRSTRRGGTVPFFFRMLEQFLPLEASDRPTQAKAAKNEKANAKNKNKNASRANEFATPSGSSSWPREVGVQRVVWNCGAGLGGAGLLASSTGSGLCRVDWVWGRWAADRVPYGGVECIRGEAAASGGDAMDVDSDESD
ncbi:Pre-mRNA splicing factor [Mycena chlorophos]|uniref:Pre-mRNA splicing factor n=1 Tax=Mycena chlorophos TaxID=658473 RepID=A0A8H6S1R1_MYCCL|nr:Pre-mRNA splicing factor [Mycena chlorophos]